MASKSVPAKKKTTTTTNDSQEASIATTNDNMQTKGDSYKVIATTSTTSLSGTCDLDYQLGLSAPGDLYLRIHSSSGTGFFSRQWLSLDEAWACLSDWEHETVTALALFPLWRHRSINTAGYVLKVLVDLGLLTASTEKQRHWDLVSRDQYQAIVTNLKAKHRPPAKRKPKAKA